MRTLLGVAVILLCSLAATAARAQCPPGSGQTACTPFPSFINSAAAPIAATPTDRGPYVQGAVTKYIPPRFPLASAVSLLVATTGADTGNCTATSCQTIQYAYNQAVANYDSKGQAISIVLAPGTYHAGMACGGQQLGIAAGGTVPAYYKIVGSGGSAVTIVDDTSGASGAFIASAGCSIGLQGLTVESSTGNGVFPYGGDVTIISDFNFGTVAADHMHAEIGGHVFVAAGYTISGSAVDHEEAILGGSIQFTEVNKTITCTGSPAFSGAFAYVGQTGVIYENSNFMSFSGCGGVTGTRYEAWTNGVIETVGGLGNYFPGNVNGFDADGGIFSPLAGVNVAISGFGSGATFTIGEGSTARAGNITVTTGTSPAGNGTFNVTYGDPVGEFDSACWMGIDYPNGVGNAQFWPNTSLIYLVSHNTLQSNWNWTTGGVSLINPGVYRVSYTCAGISGFP